MLPPPPAATSAASVAASTAPVTGSPLACWKVLTAWRVRMPKIPSAPPATGMPAAISSCWIRFTAAPCAPYCTTVPAGAGVLGDEAVPVRPRTWAVRASTTPVSGRPLTRWTSFTARSVADPNVPSAPPLSTRPVARMRCWSCVTAAPDAATAEADDRRRIRGAGGGRRCRGCGWRGRGGDRSGQPEVPRGVLGDDSGRVQAVLLLELAQRGRGAWAEVPVGPARHVVAEADQLLLHGEHASAFRALAQTDHGDRAGLGRRVSRRCARLGDRGRGNDDGAGDEHRQRNPVTEPDARTTANEMNRLSFQWCLSNRTDMSPFDQSRRPPRDHVPECPGSARRRDQGRRRRTTTSPDQNRWSVSDITSIIGVRS